MRQNKNEEIFKIWSMLYYILLILLPQLRYNIIALFIFGLLLIYTIIMFTIFRGAPKSDQGSDSEDIEISKELLSNRNKWFL